MSDLLLQNLNRLQRLALISGLAGGSLCALGFFLNARQFFISYLFAYLFWLGLALGCLCVAMIHHLTGGRWGDVTRRFLEAGYMTLPLLACLFLPIFFGVRHLYPWTDANEVARSEILQHKAHYLNTIAFSGRAFFYFLIWIILAVLLRQWSREQDTASDLTPTLRARSLAGPGLVIYTLTVTFAWIDWMMSLEADWYSTMFPVIICGGQILCALAFAIILLAAFRNQPPFLSPGVRPSLGAAMSPAKLPPSTLEPNPSPILGPGQFHQLGNLLLTFVMFWTYVSYGQLLIIWSGNLPHEIGWYRHRIAGHWQYIAEFLALFNFFLPFLLLLSRATKKNTQSLSCLAILVLFCQLLNCYWLVEPTFFPGVHFHWLDLAAPVAVGGLWLATFVASLKGAQLLTKNDPRISYSFSHAQ